MFGKRQPGETYQPEEPARNDAQLPSVIPAAQTSQDVVDSEALEQQKHAMFGQDAHARREKDIVLEYADLKLETSSYLEAKQQLLERLVTTVDFATLQKIPESKRRGRISEAVEAMIVELGAPLTSQQTHLLLQQAIDEILGHGPIEPLLADPDIADVMINTAKRVYVEKNGKIFLTNITFLNERHLMNIVQRIVTRVGRRVDEASPMVDARLEDGSRFNAIIPPLALDGALVSIRKFKKSKMSLRQYIEYDSMSPAMARFLEICGHIRLNIVISGGTGSGKTTLLNAISQNIASDERVITIEDAAELQLQQPHVLRLETRPASTEGSGEITQRQLVKNALRMRPDRIILGEVRGDEVIDVLSAMNTGHDGSMVTIHSNSPRDCLSRIENLVGMSGVQVPISSLRYQIGSAVQMIVQLNRMRDGRRRITHIEEIVGLEGDVITTQTLFNFKAGAMSSTGKLEGEFQCSGIRPRMFGRAEYYGLDKDLMECLNLRSNKL